MAQIRDLKTGIKYKNTPIGKIPVDWEVVRLRNIVSKFYNGGTPDTKNKSYWDGNIPWITGADFEGQKVKYIRRYITEEGVINSATNVVPKGNLLIVTRTGVGKLAIAPFDIAISQDITGVILDSEKALTEFIYWYLEFNASKLKLMIQGTSINGLLREDLETISFPLPPHPEQKKIAEILTTLDEAIEKTSQIIEKTKEAKKGLMQEVLARGIGHKKFKKTEIGKIPEKWQLAPLRNVSIKGSIKDPRNFPDQKFRYVDVSSVSNEFYKVTDFQIVNGRNAPSRARKEIKWKDIIYATVRPYLKRIAVVPKELDGEICSTGFCVIKCNPKLSHYKYVFYILQTDWITEKFTGLQRGSNYPAITDNYIYNQIIPMPEIGEQEQIAKILSSVDDEIEKESSHRDQLEALKKGLMQVLLTGKIRVL